MREKIEKILSEALNHISGFYDFQEIYYEDYDELVEKCEKILNGV